jgi:hypothetical protein
MAGVQPTVTIDLKKEGDPPILSLDPTLARYRSNTTLLPQTNEQDGYQ